jgi:hypothetical protein
VATVAREPQARYAERCGSVRGGDIEDRLTVGLFHQDTLSPAIQTFNALLE